MAERVQFEKREHLGLATVRARKGVPSTAIGAALGLIAPAAAAYTVGGHLALVGCAPGTWLAVSETPDGEWPEQLVRRLSGVAYVTDQSAGYEVVRITGEDARKVLQAGVHLDLHPATFGPGSAASTSIARVDVLLWRLDDGAAFEIAFYRSYADSLWEWLEQTARS